MNEKIYKVGITQGDINGIGSEVILKALSDSRMCDNATYIIYGSSKVLSYYKKNIEETENISITIISSAREAIPKHINLVNCMAEDIFVQAGTSTPEAGAGAVAALKAAATDLKAGELDVVVTAPINKANVQSEEFGFTGHTEFFASEFDGEPLMMMCSDRMKVGLATIHLPLAEVAARLSKELIVDKLEKFKKSLIVDFAIHEPRIAVLSLNPHSGDAGLLGTEERDIILPAIQEANQQKVLAFGPFAADGFFAAGMQSRYDGILAMYHDQGLIPFKTISPDGVNFTSGLNVVRTSPDHGVGYDISGTGKADAASMRNAIFMAMDIAKNRAIHAEISRNPLRHYERDRGKDVSVKDLPEQQND